LARLADQYRRSDVRLWGIVAAATTILAIASLEAPAFVPDRIFAALHATRLPAPDNGVGEIRAQIAQLKDQQSSLGAAGASLAVRVSAAEQDAGSMRHEVSTLVANLPKLVKTVPIGSTADDAMLTGAIGLPKPGISGAAVQPANDAATALAVAKTTATPPADQSVAAAQTMPADLQHGPVAATDAVPPALRPIAPPATVSPPSQTAMAAPASAPAPVASPAPIPTVAAAASIPPANSAAPASRQSDLVAEIGAYEWAQAAMTVSNTPEPASVVPTVVAPAQPTAPVQASVAPAQSPASTPVPLAPQRAMPAAAAVASANPPAKADVRAVGVAIGAPVQPGTALAAWQQLASKVGVMLVGMSPLLAEDPAGSSGKVLVAGPVANIAAATALCGKIDDAGLTCTPMPYVGANLAPAQ